jgi:hypothetical protein
VTVNPQLTRFFGYDEDELIVNPVELLLPLRLYEIRHAHRDAYLARPENRAINGDPDRGGAAHGDSKVPAAIYLTTEIPPS